MAVDLHIHSTASDGTFTPSQVVDYAQKLGLKCIALTDHDSVAGVDEAQKRAKELGLPFITGIELTVLDRGNEVHILGYFIDINCLELLEAIKETHKRIYRRIQQIVAKLNQLGFNLTVEEVEQVANGATLGRPHIARLMVKKGYITNYQEAFRRYIGEGCPAYVGIEDALKPKDAYDLIYTANGLPAIAHPGYQGRANMMIDDDIFNHKIWGAQAIEVYHSRHDSFMVDFYMRLARRYSMAITGGSDCHGNFFPQILMERCFVPDWVAEKLIAFREKLSQK